MPDYFKAVGQIDGKQYFVPFDWGFTSILYRTDKVEPVDSWTVLFDDKYDNHISMWDDGPGAVTMSHISTAMTRRGHRRATGYPSRMDRSGAAERPLLGYRVRRP